MCLEEHQEETEMGDALPLVRLQVSHEFVCLVYLASATHQALGWEHRGSAQRQGLVLSWLSSSHLLVSSQGS